MLVTADTVLTSFLAQLVPHTTVTNILFGAISYERSLFVIWFIFLTVYLIFIERRDKIFLIHFFGAMMSAYLISDKILKYIVGRARPMQPQNFFYLCPKDFSFPSTHATVSFACAYVLASFDKKRRYIYYLAAILISYSRIYLYCHYFLDVLGGALLGTLLGYLSIRLRKN